MDKKFFPTNNYYGMTKAVDALVDREPSLPGMGLIYGRWGLGKSEAIDYYYGESNINWIEIDPLWTARGLLGGILEEMRVAPEHRTNDRMRQVCKEMKTWKQPLFIDEADRLVKKPLLLDVVRFIHDKTRVPVILVGMEEICMKLQRYGQVWSRILPAGIVEFKPLVPPEAVLVAKEWCGLDLDHEAAEVLCSFIEGDWRFLVGYLVELEMACKTNKTSQVGMAMVETLLKKMARKKDLADRFPLRNVRKLRTVGRQSA